MTLGLTSDCLAQMASLLIDVEVSRVLVCFGTNGNRNTASILLPGKCESPVRSHAVISPE